MGYSCVDVPMCTIKLDKEKDTVKALKIVLTVMTDIPETNRPQPECRSGQSCSFEELASCR